VKIAIIGAGNVGGTLGKGWAKKGHQVYFGVRRPDDAETQNLLKATGGGAKAGSSADAAAFGEVVVFATPWPATEAAVKSAGDLSGKIVIDCTNPLGMGADGLQLVLGFTTSAGEQVATWAPGAFVFKTLNTTGASNMARASEFATKPMMPVAGDDAQKKRVVMELIGKLGFMPVDAGPLKNARLLEPLAMVWIDQAMKRGRGRDFAFAIVDRK